jgi:hypothetical protein
MALTLQDLYQNVLGRAPDTGGLSFWQDYAATRGGPGIDPEEIAAFVAAAQAEKPGAAYTPPRTPTLVVPEDYPMYGPSGPTQTPISNVPVVTPTPRPPLVVTPVPKTGPTSATTTTASSVTPSADFTSGMVRALTRPTYKQTTFASRRGPAPTLEQLYQNVLGRAPDTRGLEFWRNYVGSSIDPDEIAAFVAAAQAERPGAFYAGSNAPPRPLSYADTALLAGATGTSPGIPSVIGRTSLPGGQYLNPTGVSTLVPAPAVFSGTPTDPRTGKPMTETARPAVNAPSAAVQGKKAGGLATLANELESKGRNGDTELVHMTKDEVAGLHSLARSMGGQLTRNPHTGLYEASWLSDRWREVVRGGEKVANTLGLGGVYRDIKKGIKKVGDNPYVQTILTTIAGATYGPQAAAAVRTAFSLNDGQSTGKALREGAKAAATTYALQELTGIGPPGTQPPAPVEFGNFTNIPTPGPSAMISADPREFVYPVDPNSFVGGASPIGQTAMLDTPATATDLVSTGAPPRFTGLTESEVVPGYVPNTGSFNVFNPAEAPISGRGAPYVPGAPDAVRPGAIFDIGVEGAKALGIDSPYKAAVAATMGASLIQGQQEREKFKEEEKRRLADMEARRRRYREIAEGIMSRNPLRFAARGGMLDDIDDPRDEVGYGMARGGMPPRFLSGGGDGMSDSIPAVIGGKQPARLADGEFVIPADVVSHLGNGSSKAGAKQLYSMMNRIRKARTGTTKQGKEVNPRRFMPA